MSDSTPVAPGDGKATLSMILGLCSVLCLCCTGVPAIIFGVLALPGASQSGKTRAYIGIGTGAVMTVIGLLVGVFSDPPASSRSSDAPEPAGEMITKSGAGATDPVPEAVQEPEMPPSQRQFCEAITAGRQEYDAARRSGANELKLSKLRSSRTAAVLAAVPGGTVKDWVATVETLQTNGEGKAVFVVQLPCDVKLGTWNNALSDIADNSLIPQSSPLFDAIAELNTGTKLRVSGKLAAGDVDGFREASMTELGSMTDPVYILRFSGIGPL